ncbi:hypothetical protein NMG60_11036208 [Bertholletia excelsa]
MEASDSHKDFPGFQNVVPRDDFKSKRTLSRLRSRAPRPLQLKPSDSLQCKSSPSSNGFNLDSSSSSSSSSSFASYNYRGEEPKPLLSPLVLPSLIESACMKEEAAAKSH